LEWNDAETEAEGWVMINSLRSGVAGGSTRMRKGLDKREVESLAKMNMRWLALAPLLILMCLSFGQAQMRSSYWVNKDIDWKNPSTGDPEIDALVEASTVNAIIFHPNGQFRMLSTNGALGKGIIYQHVEIFKMYSGIWKKGLKGEIELSYHLVGTEREPTSPTRTVTIELNKHEFEFEGCRYIKGKKLSSETKQRLDKLAILSDVSKE
jgi:hypothetical protein